LSILPPLVGGVEDDDPWVAVRVGVDDLAGVKEAGSTMR
jgi:hypothetical protein